MITAFELFEHFSDPMNDIGNILEKCDNLIFTTNILPKSEPKPGKWWYYSPETGQHIAIYTKNALEYVANYFSKQYAGNDSMHIFSEEHITNMRLRICCKFADTLAGTRKRESLLSKDYESITGRTLS